VPTAGSQLGGITAGPDGNLWFAEATGNKIGRITLPRFAELAVFRQTTGEWFIRHNTGDTSAYAWGTPALGDVPVPGDYDGDGRADIGVYRTTTGEWLIRRSSNGGLIHVGWGWPAGDDRAAPGDYDAGGRTDIAVYRTTTGEWFIRRSSDGGLTHLLWGWPAGGDVPVPARY
jgi:hypothetical protein